MKVIEMKAIALSRRRFLLTTASFAAGAVLLKACGGRNPKPGETQYRNGSYTVTSRADDTGHTHSFTIPAELLENIPSEEHTFTTTESDGHTHTLTLSPISLTLIRDRRIDLSGVFTIEDDTGHQHEFEIDVTS